VKEYHGLSTKLNTFTIYSIYKTKNIGY